MAKKTVQDIILEGLVRLEDKVDKIATEKLPNVLLEVAVINERTSKSMKFYTIMGGAITVLLSIGTAVAVAWLKR